MQAALLRARDRGRPRGPRGLRGRSSSGPPTRIPDTPLARALAVRAAQELAAANARARALLRAAEATVVEGGRGGRRGGHRPRPARSRPTCSTWTRRTSGPEIAEYVAGGGRPEDVDQARSVHGRPRDPHLGARSAWRLDGRRTRGSRTRPTGSRVLAWRAPRPRPGARDLVWVPTILALDAGGDRALARGRGLRSGRRRGVVRRSSASAKPERSMCDRTGPASRRPRGRRSR